MAQVYKACRERKLGYLSVAHRPRGCRICRRVSEVMLLMHHRHSCVLTTLDLQSPADRTSTSDSSIVRAWGRCDLCFQHALQRNNQLQGKDSRTEAMMVPQLKYGTVYNTKQPFFDVDPGRKSTVSSQHKTLLCESTLMGCQGFVLRPLLLAARDPRTRTHE